MDVVTVVSLFKAMLQWLANCSVEDGSFQNYSYFSPYLKHTVSMHVNVIRQNYNIIDL